MTAARNTVVSVRLDDLSMQALDLLVESGLASSRSEAAAQFISIGIRSGEELLLKARELAEQLRQVKQEMVGAVKARDVERVKAILDQDARVIQAPVSDGETPLLTSVYYGAREITELLLARGAHQNVYEAAAVGDTARVQELVEAEEALINTYSHDGWTPLHLAAFFGHPETVSYLLSKGARVDAVSHNAMANLPLHAALASRREDCGRLLIESGTPLNARDSAGWTPLHHASLNGMAETVQLLLAKGAPVDVRNDKGLTPLAAAQEKGHTEIINLLEQYR